MGLRVPDARDRQLCPKRPRRLVCDQQPGLWVPASCDSYSCEVCGPRKAMATADVLAWGARQVGQVRLFTGTLAPEQWKTRQQKMNDLARILRRRGRRWECAWVTEANLEPNLLHVHGLQHGDDIPVQDLAATWGARVELLSISDADTTAAARYLVKETRRGPDQLRASWISTAGGQCTGRPASSPALGVKPSRHSEPSAGAAGSGT